MKLLPMNYHYLRYPLSKFLHFVESSPFIQEIDLYCAAPQLDVFHVSLKKLLDVDRELQQRDTQVNTMTLDLLGDYSEYFLLQLPDDSYVLAQMSSDDARSIKAGKKVTLPIGKKGGVYQQALDNIADLCREYDVYTEGIFYCVNDQWNAEHHIMVQLARLGIGFLVTIVLGAILITILDKIMKVKD